MAILRSDQSQLTFAAEAAQGGSPEMNQGDRQLTNPFVQQLQAAANAGDMQINANAETYLAIGQHIRIGGVTGVSAGDLGSSAIIEFEIRRVEHFTGTGTDTIIYLDRPLAFYHASTEQLQEVVGTSTTEENLLITHVPGVYESVTVPDMVPTIEPRYYLGTTAKRQAAEFYAGQQSYSGSIGGMVLLNANPLRFPIGKMVSQSSHVKTSSHVSSQFPSAGAKKGDVFITIDSTSNAAAGDLLLLNGNTSAPGSATSLNLGTNYEVVKVKAVPASGTLELTKPLRFDHLDNYTVTEIDNTAGTNKFTHTITPQNDLDTLSWHLHMRDSGETTANDFNRRYYGGMVDSATISGEEGGLLTVGWDTVNFMGMVHNQEEQAGAGAVGTTPPAIYPDGIAGMPKFAIMSDIESGDIDFPANNPYYFSQGSVKLFGQEVARMRNFNISISNATEPRYYINSRYGRNRGPSEIREGRKSYSMSCTLALPDSVAATANTYTGATGALEIFKQLILEGNYGDADGAKGFAIQILFTRGTDDTLQIDIPGDGGVDAGINEQGAFITSAPHNITGDGSALQVDVDMIFRDLQIVVIEPSTGQAVYP